ncbi:MAG: hypothetical protein OXI25_06520 [Chloroflexota bacterium]|nr:hypothetical protein [Chloroflexota bacterium]
MMDDAFELPAKPFFSCDEGEFAVVDAEQMGTNLSVVEPMLTLRVGPGNVFEQRPRRVVSNEEGIVNVECDGGETVTLDFNDIAARKSGPAGEFVYRAGLDEGNEGAGWMRAR